MSSVDIMLLITSAYVIQSLSPALVDIRKMCYQIRDTGLCHLEKKHTYTLQEFRDSQFQQLQEVRLYILYKNWSRHFNSIYMPFVCLCVPPLKLISLICSLLSGTG